MKAMLLRATAPIRSHPLERTDLLEPEPGQGEVRLKVSCCAVCRTDLHVIEGDPPSQKRPLVPGHQIVGVVDRLGCLCHRISVGQRVGVAWLRQTCGKCKYCLTGSENLCEAARFTGYHADGGYAEYAVVSEEFAYSVPDAFSDLEACAIALRRHYRLSRTAAKQPAAGRQAGNLRIWVFGAHRNPDRSAPRMRGLRGNDWRMRTRPSST